MHKGPGSGAELPLALDWTNRVIRGKGLVEGSLGLWGVPTQTQGWEQLAMQIQVELACGSAFGTWRPWGQGEGLEEDGPLGAPPVLAEWWLMSLPTWQPEPSGPCAVSSHWLNHSLS